MTFCESLLSLRQSPREMFVMCLLKLFTAFGYFSVSAVFVLYVSNEHGYNDRDAGALYGSFGLACAIVSIVTGPLIDHLGIRRSIVIGALVASLGMFIMALSFDRTSLMVALFGLMPFGASLGLPVVDIGGKRYSTPSNIAVVFALLYATMNVGAAIAGAAFDGLRYAIGTESGRIRVRDYDFGSERLLIMAGGVVTAIAGLIAALTIRDITVSRDGTVVFKDVHKQPPQPPPVLDADGGARDRLLTRCCWNPLKWYWHNVIKKRKFWQLMAFSASLIFVRQIFRNFDTTLPKWALRVLGPDAPIGSLYAINPTMIVLIGPLAAAVFSRFDMYTVLIIGSTISAASIYILAGKASLELACLALIVFSVGEAIYSPQTTTFALVMSPKNEEGTYSSLASAPLFMSTLLVGIMSGELTQTYCPAAVMPGDSDGERRCAMIWVIVASVAMVTPVLLLALRRFIYSPDLRHALSAGTHQIKSNEALARSHSDDDDNDPIGVTGFVAVTKEGGVAPA